MDIVRTFYGHCKPFFVENGLKSTRHGIMHPTTGEKKAIPRKKFETKASDELFYCVLDRYTDRLDVKLFCRY